MKKLVFLSSPLRGDEIRNTEFAKRLARRIMLQYTDVAILAPHLHYPRFLSDRIRIEREIALDACQTVLSKCDELWYTDFYGITAGMEAELQYAKDNDIPIRRIHDENVSLCCVKPYDVLITNTGEGASEND